MCDNSSTHLVNEQNPRMHARPSSRLQYSVRARLVSFRGVKKSSNTIPCSQESSPETEARRKESDSPYPQPEGLLKLFVLLLALPMTFHGPRGNARGVVMRVGEQRSAGIKAARYPDM